MISPANVLTGTKQPAFSTDRLTDIDKTKCNYSQVQHKNLNNQAEKQLTDSLTKPN